MKESTVVTQYYVNVMNTLCKQNADVPLIFVGSAYNNRCALARYHKHFIIYTNN